MDEKTATQLAAIVGGEAWMSGGGIWLVTVTRQDGSLVVFGDGCIGEYASDEAFDRGQSMSRIDIEIPESYELYVIVEVGTDRVIYNEPDMKRGWVYQEDAGRELDALVSRGAGQFMVVRQGDVEND